MAWFDRLTTGGVHGLAARRLGGLALVALGCAYPLAVYLLLGRVPVRAMLGLLVAALAARALSLSRGELLAYAPLGAILALNLAAGLFSGDLTHLLLVPVLTSLGLLALFGFSLLGGLSFVERVALAREPDLPPAGRAYCRKLTAAWCAIFAGNAAISLWTALGAPLEIWALYNGLVSYILIGGFAAGEYLYRRAFRRRLSETGLQE